MEHNKKGLTKNQQKKLLKTFGISAGITLVVCVVAIIGVVIAYNNLIWQKPESTFKNEVLSKEEQEKEDDRKERGEINKTIAVFGVDKDETRTDVILVVNFNSMTNKVKVISIPRDTKVTWSERQRSKYNQLTGYSISVTKLNEMSAYGQIYNNPANIRDFTINEIENILTVPIDNYVIVNIEAFNKIVDAIGGVEVDVPQRMYYQDTSQALYIDLQPGLQTLYGKDAEGLVRYRHGYAEGDVGRIATQQVFLEAFAKKVMSPAILNNLPSIITSLFTYVKTDVALTEVFDYLTLLNDFELDNLEFHTMPGEGAYYQDVSYFFIDQEELSSLIKEVFYDTTVAGEEPEATPGSASTEESMVPVIDQGVSIEIYNATDAKGLAGTLKDTLQKRGYNVARIDNYEEGTILQSVIYAKDETKARQFLEYMESAEIIQDSSIETDIKIIIGEDLADKLQ